MTTTVNVKGFQPLIPKSGINSDKTGSLNWSAFNNATSVNLNHYLGVFVTINPDGTTYDYNTYKSVFYNCTKLTTVTNLNNTVKDMSYAFYNCISLVNIPPIPSSVKNMSYTFGKCVSIIDAPIIPNNVTSIVGTFSGCSNLV